MTTYKPQATYRRRHDDQPDIDPGAGGWLALVYLIAVFVLASVVVT